MYRQRYRGFESHPLRSVGRSADGAFCSVERFVAEARCSPRPRQRTVRRCAPEIANPCGIRDSSCLFVEGGSSSPPFTLSPRSRWQRTSSLPLSLARAVRLIRSDGAQEAENAQCRARKSAGTAWNADLRSASRGSAKPALITLRFTDVSAPPSHNPGWSDRSPPPAAKARRAVVLGAWLRRAQRGRGRNRGRAAGHAGRQEALPGAAAPRSRGGASNRGWIEGEQAGQTLPPVPGPDGGAIRGGSRSAMERDRYGGPRVAHPR